MPPPLPREFMLLVAEFPLIVLAVTVKSPVELKMPPPLPRLLG